MHPPIQGALEVDRELIELGDGGPLGPAASTVAVRRFEALAAADPDAVAVISHDETLTYGQLDARAEAIARKLRSVGVGREVVVGICLPSRLDVLTAIVAVMKSGGAYLPLDLVQPLERRRFMLADAGASALITVAAWREELADGSIAVVTPDDWQTVASNGHAPAAGGPELDDLAYIIYTSGSTGQPKGVMIEQRSLAAYVDWGVSSFSREELSVVLMATSFGFDMSVFEFTIPLAAGGTIVLVDNLFELPDVAHHGLTLVNAVPSLMAAALSSGITLPESVRTAVFCGETLPFEVSEAVHRQPGIERVMNTYGPTEDTVYSTFVDVPRGQRPTIGRSFPGTQAYVVDDELSLLPRGEAGELCLSGVGLARGYKGRPELTQDRFVPNPHPNGSDRLYRTGDLARWEDDGSLQHLGRIDHQIKLRGVRIEPGDIEEALLRHPQVRQAVVVARERPAGGKWLVAYMVCEEGAEPEGRELRAMLRESLPKPMIPSVFVRIDEMPLNANGKLDRAKLPEPLTSTGSSRPLTETESALAALWRDLLSLEGLPGPEDDYFELGGDSLKAFELFLRVEERLGRELSPNVLLEASTVGSLAALIDSGAERGRLVQVNAGGARIPTVYVHSGAGGMLTLRKISAALGPDQPLFGIQAFDDREIEAGNIEGVEPTALECIAALREVQPHGPYILAGHSIGGHIAYEMAVQLVSEGESILFLGLLDPPAPHTLKRPARIVARTLDVTGLGSEPRRRGAHRAVIATAMRTMRSRLKGGTTTVYGEEFDAGPSAWMRHLYTLERAYQPRSYRGRVAVYTTADGARYTGSRTLGWHRYVDGLVETRRIPGDHVSMLLEPNIDVLAAAVDADVRQAQQTAPAAGRG
jgi:amino acid adenylation domain-containing protein